MLVDGINWNRLGVVSFVNNGSKRLDADYGRMKAEKSIALFVK